MVSKNTDNVGVAVGPTGAAGAFFTSGNDPDVLNVQNAQDLTMTGCTPIVADTQSLGKLTIILQKNDGVVISKISGNSALTLATANKNTYREYTTQDGCGVVAWTNEDGSIECLDIDPSMAPLYSAFFSQYNQTLCEHERVVKDFDHHSSQTLITHNSSVKALEVYLRASELEAYQQKNGFIQSVLSGYMEQYVLVAQKALDTLPNMGAAPSSCAHEVRNVLLRFAEYSENPSALEEGFVAVRNARDVIDMYRTLTEISTTHMQLIGRYIVSSGLEQVLLGIQSAYQRLCALSFNRPGEFPDELKSSAYDDLHKLSKVCTDLLESDECPLVPGVSAINDAACTLALSIEIDVESEIIDAANALLIAGKRFLYTDPDGSIIRLYQPESAFAEAMTAHAEYLKCASDLQQFMDQYGLTGECGSE